MKKIIYGTILLFVIIILLFVSYISYNIITINKYQIPENNLKIINQINNLKKDKEIPYKNNLYYFLNKKINYGFLLKGKKIRLNDIKEIKNHTILRGNIIKPLMFNYYGIENKGIFTYPNQYTIYNYYNTKILKIDLNKDQNNKSIIKNAEELHKSLERNYKNLIISKNSDTFQFYQRFLNMLELKKEYQNLDNNSGHGTYFNEINNIAGINYFNNLIYNKEINKIIKALNILVDTNNIIINSKYVAKGDIQEYITTNKFIIELVGFTNRIKGITPIQKKELLKIINKITPPDKIMNIYKYTKIKEIVNILEKDSTLDYFFFDYYLYPYLSNAMSDKIINYLHIFINYKKINKIEINFVQNYYKNKIYLKSEEENMKYIKLFAGNNIILQDLFNRRVDSIKRNYIYYKKIFYKNIIILKKELVKQ